MGAKFNFQVAHTNHGTLDHRWAYWTNEFVSHEHVVAVSKSRSYWGQTLSLLWNTAENVQCNTAIELISARNSCALWILIDYIVIQCIKKSRKRHIRRADVSGITDFGREKPKKWSNAIVRSRLGELRICNRFGYTINDIWYAWSWAES